MCGFGLRSFQYTQLDGKHRKHIPVIPFTQLNITTPEVTLDNFRVVK